MPTVAIFNQKGGVGKTTTALNLCAALAQSAGRPIGIDLDPQGHLTLACGMNPAAGAAGSLAFFQGAGPPQVKGIALASGVRLVPAAYQLATIDALHGADPGIATRLRAGIAQSFPRETGTLLIDCCPVLSVLTLNALFAADCILIPVAADYLSMQGVYRVKQALDVIEARRQSGFTRRIVITRFDARRRLSHDICARIVRDFGPQVCATRIPESVALAESPLHGKDIFAFAPRGPGAAAYAALAAELTRDGFFG